MATTYSGVTTKQGLGKVELEPLSMRANRHVYGVTGNPFAIPLVLPLIAAAVLAMDVAMLLNADPRAASGGLLVFVCGLLLIPALVQRGRLDINGDGLTFTNKNNVVTGDWQNVAITNDDYCGPCITIYNPAMSATKDQHMPGGFEATKASTKIPFRLFGDRRFSILYDMEYHVPDNRWQDALEAAGRWETNSRVIYAVVTAVCCLAIIGLYFGYAS